MDQFNPQTIVNLLIVCVVLYVAVRGFINWCKRVDAEWAAKNPPVPDQDTIAAAHVEKRTPALYRSPSAADAFLYMVEEDDIQRQMMADTLRGTKL